MPRLIRFFTVLLAALALSPAALAAYALQTLNVPGASNTRAWGINDSGDIVGYFVEAGEQRGFLYRNGAFSTIAGPPGASQSGVTGISNDGLMVGVYVDVGSTEFKSFLYDGTLYTPFLLAGASATEARSISADGRYLAGNADGFDRGGFAFDRLTGNHQLIGTVGGFTIAQGVNDLGQVVGSTSVPGAGSAQQPFVFDMPGASLHLSLPGFEGLVDPRLRAINNGGAMGGFANGGLAFVGHPGAFETLAFPGASFATIYGLNNSGVAVGNYTLPDGSYHSFVATPVPEPTSGLLLGAGLLFVAHQCRRAHGGCGAGARRRGRPASLLALLFGLLLPGTQALAAAQVAAAQLAEVSHAATVEYASPGAPSQTVSDPFLAIGAGSGVSASADYAGGILKGVATSTDNFGQFASARSGLLAIYQNTGDTPIFVNDLTGKVHAVFARTLGTDEFGSVAHTMVATLFGAGPGFSGASQGIYDYTASNSATAPPELTFSESGGFTVTGNATADSLDLQLAFPAFTLLPGETLRVGFSAAASAMSLAWPGMGGWSATSDYSSTGFLSMTLPAGVSVVSERPLTWVSVVPEPASWTLLLAGLAALGCIGRQRQRA